MSVRPINIFHEEDENQRIQKDYILLYNFYCVLFVTNCKKKK